MEEIDLYRDEEDLIDYEDSDVEFKTEGDERSSIPTANDDLQLDIYSDDAIQPEVPAQEITFDNQEESAEPHKQYPTNVAASTFPSTKTPQAATLIKSLQDLLAEPTFQASLGLSAPDDVVDLTFWANGSDFALTLKLVGVADTKACNFGAKCFRADCTFDHGGADRSLVIAAGQRRKLCTMINTPSGCPKGQACWFSHDAEGMSCSYGSLRDTCPKGPYCFYTHDDDAVVVPTEAVPSLQGDVAGDLNTDLLEMAAKHSDKVEVSQVPTASEDPFSNTPAKVAGRKRGRTLEEEESEPRIQGPRRKKTHDQSTATSDTRRRGFQKQARRDSINTPQGNRGRKAQARKDTGRAGKDDASKRLIGSGGGSGNGKGGKGNGERSLRSRMTRD
jgi:hypothetical protein